MEAALGIAGLGLLVVGLAGCSASTFWFLMLARVSYQRSPIQTPSDKSLPLSLEILIPATNAEATIGETIGSVQLAIKRLWKSHPEIRIRITVGAGSCTDKTISVARSKFVVAKEIPNHHSRWDSIKFLTHQSSAEWVALVEPTALWPETLLLDLFDPEHWDRNALALSPSARDSLLSYVESKMLNLENGVGGPASACKLTTLYRRANLLHALSSLHLGHWVHDELAIPLMLRSQTANKRLVYKELPKDREPRRLSSAAAKKSGNPKLEISALLPEIRAHHPVIALLAYRQLAKLTLPYWLGALLVGILTLTLGLLKIA